MVEDASVFVIIVCLHYLMHVGDADIALLVAIDPSGDLIQRRIEIRTADIDAKNGRRWWALAIAACYVDLQDTSEPRPYRPPIRG